MKYHAIAGRVYPCQKLNECGLAGTVCPDYCERLFGSKFEVHATNTLILASGIGKVYVTKLYTLRYVCGLVSRPLWEVEQFENVDGKFLFLHYIAYVRPYHFIHHAEQPTYRCKYRRKLTYAYVSVHQRHYQHIEQKPVTANRECLHNQLHNACLDLGFLYDLVHCLYGIGV